MATKFLAKISQKITKMAVTSVATHQCRVCIWDRVCTVREFTCDTPIHKGQRAVTMATNFGTKIAINAYKSSENVITYNRGFSWSTNPKKTCMIARV